MSRGSAGGSIRKLVTLKNSTSPMIFYQYDSFGITYTVSDRVLDRDWEAFMEPAHQHVLLFLEE